MMMPVNTGLPVKNSKNDVAIQHHFQDITLLIINEKLIW